MKEFTYPADFEPRPYQRRFMSYFDAGGKRAVWVVHRRGGKDLTALHQTVKMMLERRGVYWHVFPTSEQARKAIWEGFTKDGKRIMDMVFPRDIRKSPRGFLPNAEMIVELRNGSIWRLIGSDKIEVVGAGPVGVVFSEYALAKPTAWNMIRPMLRENGGWAAFITTPRGNNHAKKLYDMAGKEPGWFRDLQTLHDTRAYDPEATIAEERAEGMPEALIRQEYLCDWSAALVGSVWGDLLEAIEKRGGLKPFEHETDGVFTSWDFGIGDKTAIWFWRVNGNGVDFIDYYEESGKPISHYFDLIDAKGYDYLKHFIPHDARARTLQTGVSTQDLFLKHFGGTKVAITPGLSFADGIQAGRWLLQQPVRFHPRCEDGIECLRQYHYAWDEDKKILSSKPEHDWSSHGSDAARYTAVVVKSAKLLAGAKARRETKSTTTVTAEPFLLDPLPTDFDDEPRRRI